MGVRGLLSYVQGQCPDAFERVDLRRLADQYYQRYNAKPQLLIDCNGYIRDIYGSLEFAFGGQWLQYLEHIKEFIRYFQNAGFELLVMFDGVVEKKKIKTWIDRRQNERKSVSKIFDFIKHSGRHPDHKLFHIPTSLSTLTRFAMKGLGVTIYNSSIEVDRELFLHCRNSKSFGIVSRDTDFMIFDVPQWLYITCSNGHVREVQLFRRDIFCHHLGIPPQFLGPLLACLLGCDTVSFPMLSQFHKRVTRGKRDPLVPSVAGYIRSLQLRDLSKISLHSVAYDVGRAFQHDYLYECIQDYACDQMQGSDVPSRSGAAAGPARAPVESSCTSHINQSVMNKVASYHRNLDITDFVLQVIALQEYRSNMTMDDDTDTATPSSGLVYRPIRQRLYGILLQSPVQGSAVGVSGPVNAGGLSVQFGTVEEMCAYAGNPMDVPDVVQGMPLDIAPHPRLEDLCVDDITDDVKRLRLRVFFSCMYCTKLFEDGILDAIPDHHILLCCILHFLLLHAPESTLRSCDIDAFIAQAICFQGHSPSSLKQLQVPRVSSRGVHRAAIFVRGLTTGLFANSTCCLPFRMESLMPWYTFDGKLFHIKYIAAEDGSTLEQLCEHKPRAVEMFHKMKGWIIRGTRLQSH